MISPRLHDALVLLPDYLGQHMMLTVTALAIGILISLPLAILATRWRPLRAPLLTITGVLQTVPSLALLALMVPLLGRIGFLPALIALILYSMLPMVRNTITGIQGVNPDLIEAAQGIGMTDMQRLWRVELPLAAPVILAGIRTATVWVVGVATLSTPVGATSLGNFIFSGLQTQNYTAVLVGVFAAAGLAILLDLLIRLLEVASKRRSLGLGLLGATLLIVAFGGALYPKWAKQNNHPEAVQPKPPVVIGTKTFTEQYILADVMSNLLKRDSLAVESVQSLGSTVVFDALANNSIDVYVDYSGTIWANHMKRTDNPGADSVLAEMARWLEQNYGIVTLGALGFENAYAFAMRRDEANGFGIRSIADLVPYAPDMSIGGDYEFFQRPEWKDVKRIYGLSFGAERSFDSSLMYPAVRNGQVDVIAAFSTDGRIAAFNLALLRDPKHALPPYDAVLLLSPNAAKRPEVVEALRPLVGSIDNRAMRLANKAVDVDGKSVHEAAMQLLNTISPGLDSTRTADRSETIE